MGLLSGSGAAAYKSVDRTNFTATAGQTTFTLSQGYAVGDVDVFLNGVKLLEGDDYFATNGFSIVLNSAAGVGDFVQVVSYNQFNVANAYTKSEADTRYMVATGQTPMQSYLRSPNYGVSSWSDTDSVSLEASQGSGTQGVSVKAWGRSMPTYGGDVHYVTDTRGVSGSHRFYGWSGTTWTEYARIDSSGRLAVANQPIASVSYGGTDIAATNIIQLNNRPITRGGMVIANNRITVPVSGVYIVGYHHLATSNGCQVSIRVNGVDINGGGGSRTQGHAPTNHDNFSVQNPVYINANEYIEFYVINSTVHGNADYNRMYAYLVS
jgi:hypothetical protein